MKTTALYRVHETERLKRDARELARQLGRTLLPHGRADVSRFYGRAAVMAAIVDSPDDLPRLAEAAELFMDGDGGTDGTPPPVRNLLKSN